MSDSIASPTPPLSTLTLGCYPYVQYADDPNVVAFFTATNQIAQGYLSWFAATPLAVYTSPNISGPLLNWIGKGIYGITRPVFSNSSTIGEFNAVNAQPLNTMAIDGSSFSTSGAATQATDDYYKRVITWQTYIGDGRIFNAMILRRRVARFLYGVNGTDITASQAQNVSIEVETSPLKYVITIPAGANPASTYFSEALNAGILGFPFQIAFGVVMT